MGFDETEEEVPYMKLFPFSLIDEAKEWLKSYPNQSMTNWNDLERKFLIRLFPPKKHIRSRSDIRSFTQATDESLYEAWKSYKTLLKKCPNDGYCWDKTTSEPMSFQVIKTC